MATSREGSSLPTSSYGAGGGRVGGKFQKRSFSKSRSTPYDRPRTAIRNPNWLSKLFLDPASKLLAASARRFFSSVFRKRLPPPSTPLLLSPPAANPVMTNGLQDSHIPKHSESVLTAAAVNYQSVIGEDSCGISELEQLLKQKTLTRHEIDRLTELLQSKAVDLPVTNNIRMDASSPLKPVKLKDFWLENMREREGPHQNISTPETSARVLGDDITTPSELAITYEGSRPSKQSSPEMSFRGQTINGNRNLLSNLPSSPSSSVMSLEMTTTSQLDVQKYSFPILRSRGRSAIYRMAGTSYLRKHQTTSGKANECNGNLLASPTLLKQYSESGWKETGRKRSNAVLDDDIGSVGPIRRIRGRHSLVSRKASFPFGVKDGVQQTLSPNHRGSKPDEDTNIASTSYCHMPPKSRETAARILLNVEKMKQKDNSSESKLFTNREKSPLISLQNGGDSLKLLEGTQNGDDLFHRSSNGIDGFNYLKQKKAEENRQKNSDRQRDTTLVVDSDSTVSAQNKLSSSVPYALPTLPVAQLTKKKHGFMMSVHEDFLDMDEDTYCNGLAPESSVEVARIVEHETSGTERDPPTENLTVDETPGFSETRKTHMEHITMSENSSASFAFPTLSLPEKPLQSHASSSSFEKPNYVEASFASVSEVFTPKFSSWTEPIPSSSNRPGVAVNISKQVPGSTEHEEDNLQEVFKGKEKPETQISIPFSSSISPSILPDPSNINNNTPSSTNIPTPQHTSTTSTSLTFPAFQFGSSAKTSTAVSLISEPPTFKNELDKGANVTSASIGSSIFDVGSCIDSSSKFQSQGTGSESESIVATVPEKTPLLFSSSTLTSTAPLSSSMNMFGSGSIFNLSTSSALKSDTSSSSIFTSSSAVSTGFSVSNAVSSISNSIPNNIFSFGSGPVPVINALSNVATTSNTMPTFGSHALTNVATTSNTMPTFGSHALTNGATTSNTMPTFGSHALTNAATTSNTTPTFGSNALSNVATTSNTTPTFGSNALSNVAITSNTMPTFGSTFNSSSSSSSLFSFGASSTFSTPVSSFQTASTSPSPFTNFPSTFTATANNDQMNTEDMAEDPVQSQPIVVAGGVFGQQSMASSPPPPGFSFGSIVPPAASAFQLGGGQQSQGPGSFEINHGGNFSLGSAGGDDKSSRRFVKVNKTRHRKIGQRN